MGYFYLTVGIKCFYQCTMKGINHWCILLSTSQKKVLQSYIKNGCWPTSQLFCFSYELLVYQHVVLCSFGTMTRLMGWSDPEESCHCKQHCGPQLDLGRRGHECTHMCTDTGAGSSLACESIMSCQPWKSQWLRQWDVQPDNLISGCSQTRSALNSSTTCLCLIISQPSDTVKHKPSYLGFIAIQLMSR